MPSISFCFRVHQPYRLKQYEFKDIDVLHCYDDEDANIAAINKVADECYLPANKIILNQIEATGGKFKVAFSISGTVLELLQLYRKDVIDSFKELIKTGCVEILAETYNNSLSWLHSKKEFALQVEKHSLLIRELFDTAPVVFRNTELIYNNELVQFIAAAGYKGILCEGLSRILNGRTANQTYACPGNNDFGVLLRNMELSDDIAFRFGATGWSQHPLTAQKFADWIHAHTSADTCNINLFFDYETFGIHKKVDTGIFEFLQHLPAEILTNPEFYFKTPTEALAHCYPKDVYDVPETISWEDKNNDCCLWGENVMQHNTIRKIYSLENMVLKSGDEKITATWRKLQTVDYFYFMSAHQRCEGDAYHLLNPFCSARDAFKTYSNILTDFEISMIKSCLQDNPHKFSNSAHSVLY
ncbi:glycoside hydrolase family 57 protein [Ferruginibacter sp. SUN106]|uniref:glycoside hydrolase family 57 protein n=1 Tax=Ferruginibacter sp. SUN106 TaxID=2978348 RepID=UPI003D36A548